MANITKCLRDIYNGAKYKIKKVSYELEENIPCFTIYKLPLKNNMFIPINSSPTIELEYNSLHDLKRDAVSAIEEDDNLDNLEKDEEINIIHNDFKHIMDEKILYTE